MRDFVGDIDNYIAKIDEAMNRRRVGSLSYEYKVADPTHLRRLLVDLKAYVEAERTRAPLVSPDRTGPMIRKGPGTNG